MAANADGAGSERVSSRDGGTREQALRLVEIMALIAGLAVGMWLIASEFKPAPGREISLVLVAAAGVLGGLSLAGLPMILWERRRSRGRFGPGKLLWFATGTAAWLLWPPVVFRKARETSFSDTASGMCFAYGTPLMALYVTAALLAGGRLDRRGRRRLRLSWREQFDLYLGLAWACMGLYVLYLLYHEDHLGE